METTTEPVVLNGIDAVRAAEGTVLGHSAWLEVTQPMIDQFAEATGDRQWIHVDPQRAAAGPYGRTIAHGYLTLSLAPALMKQIVRFEGFSMNLNYGCDRVRFPAPVPVGSMVRCRAVLAGVTDVPAGVQTAVEVTFEVQGESKPACVATVLTRRLP